VCFATDIDPETHQLVGRTNTFEIDQEIASATYIPSFGEGRILLTTQVSRVEADGTETVEYEGTARPAPQPNDNMAYGKGDFSLFLSGPGTYVMRVSVGQYVQNGPKPTAFLTAEGTFQLVASTQP
jgi:hypothetical protein